MNGSQAADADKVSVELRMIYLGLFDRVFIPGRCFFSRRLVNSAKQVMHSLFYLLLLFAYAGYQERSA